MDGAAIRSPEPVLEADIGHPTAAEAKISWLNRLIEAEGPAILRMLWRLLGREQDVMDAYQDCFCNLAARKHPSDLRNAKAYAYRTAANIAIEMIRARRRRAAHWPAIAADRPEDAPTPDGGPEERPVTHSRLREALAGLPAHLRNVVVLRDLSRMSYEEVGRVLRIQPATARVYRRHAVVKLAEAMNQGAEP
jgi:RNA polymerase sigma-70 factor (ECF subfamily)